MSGSETPIPTAVSRSDAPARPNSRVGRLARPTLARLRQLGPGRKGVWASITGLLVLTGALASVLGARAVASSDADQGRLAFHLASAEIASTLKLAIQHEEDLVVSASAFITGNPNATPAGFDRWVESVHAMQRYPELQNIGLVTLVQAPHLAAFESHLAANPVRPLGAHSAGFRGALQILPRAGAPTTASRLPALPGAHRATSLRAWTIAPWPRR